MWRRDVVKERSQRQTFGLSQHGFFGLSKAGKNGAAALRFRAQQPEIVCMRIVLELPLEFMRDDSDRAERSSQLMRGGGGQRAQSAEPVFACQRKLRRRKCRRHARCFAR